MLKNFDAISEVIHWLHRNLFDGFVNAIISIFLLAFVAAAIWGTFEWAVLHSVWNAGSLAECRQIIASAHGADASGACWAVINGRVEMLLFGFFPPDQHWRLITAFALLIAFLIPIVLQPFSKITLFLVMAYAATIHLLIWGGAKPQHLLSRQLGGLALVFYIAVCAIALAIPIGVALGIARHYAILPIRALCASLIAYLQAIPIILLLFASVSTILLFVPPGKSIVAVIQIIGILSLHAGCRIADEIHRELKAVPNEQYEAATALGISPRQTLFLVVLPQVLRNISPWMVASFSGVVRDTGVIGAIGMITPIAIGWAIKTDSDWNEIVWETGIILCLIFGVLSFSLMWFSKHLDRKISAEGISPNGGQSMAKTRSELRQSSA